VTREQRLRLDALLVADDGGRPSPLDRLRDGPYLRSGAELSRAVGRLDEVAGAEPARASYFTTLQILARTAAMRRTLPDRGSSRSQRRNTVQKPLQLVRPRMQQVHWPVLQGIPASPSLLTTLGYACYRPALR